MLKPNNAAKKTARHTQLRGLELERRIEEVIRELAAQVVVVNPSRTLC